MLRYCETKQVRRKIVTAAPFYPWQFSIPEFFWNTEGFLEKTFGQCETKIFRGEELIPPPPLIHKLFRQRNFSGTQHRRVPLRNVTLLSDKTISTENRDTRTSLILYMFRYQTIFWNHEGFLYEMFRYCDTNKFRRKLLIPAPSFP